MKKTRNRRKLKKDPQRCCGNSHPLKGFFSLFKRFEILSKLSKELKSCVLRPYKNFFFLTTKKIKYHNFGHSIALNFVLSSRAISTCVLYCTLTFSNEIFMLKGTASKNINSFSTAFSLYSFS